MARYADVDKLIWQVQNSDKYGTITKQVFISLLQNSETEDVAPVVHAHWNEFSDYTGTCYAECSRCGLLWWIEEGTAEENEMFYCPKCGAKMDEKEGKE